MFSGPKLYYWLAVLFSLYCCMSSWPTFVFKALFWGFAGVLFLLLVVDVVLLWRKSWKVQMRRTVNPRLSCGDENKVTISLLSSYSGMRYVTVLDEIPDDFQLRDFKMKGFLRPGEILNFDYFVRPLRRGGYQFGAINVLVSTSLGLLERRFRLTKPSDVIVCPSYAFVRSAQILSVDNYMRMIGEHKVRKVGQSLEFDSLRDYVKGDDYRTINWKATARRAGKIMVNQFVDETRQTAICVIDKGRGMQHAFDGLSLLDYAVNAAVRLSYVMMRHSDDAGIVTFERKVDMWIKPKCDAIGHFNTMLDKLCHERSSFAESDYTALEQHIRANVSRRSLVVLFGSFDSLNSLRRRMPVLRSLAQRHLLLVVLFEDVEVQRAAMVAGRSGLEGEASNHDYIVSTLAQNVMREKRQMVRELHRNGVEAMLTSAMELNVNVVSRYLSLKASGRL